MLGLQKIVRHWQVGMNHRYGYASYVLEEQRKSVYLLQETNFLLCGLMPSLPLPRSVAAQSESSNLSELWHARVCSPISEYVSRRTRSVNVGTVPIAAMGARSPEAVQESSQEINWDGEECHDPDLREAMLRLARQQDGSVRGEKYHDAGLREAMLRQARQQDGGVRGEL